MKVYFKNDKVQHEFILSVKWCVVLLCRQRDLLGLISLKGYNSSAPAGEL